MILIAHRGNLTGPNEILENNIDYVSHAIQNGFNVEIDVWWHSNSFYLGHDFPKWKLENEKLLQDPMVWCHTKNLEALDKLSLIDGSNYFWHQTDDYTLTSKKFIWTYPGKNLLPNSICVTNEKQLSQNEFNKINCYGICSDYVEMLRMY